MYPRLVINLAKIKKNTEKIVNLARKEAVEIVGVTKGVCGDKRIGQAMLDGGAKYLADSRVKNINHLSQLDTELIYLKVPALSELKEIVKYNLFSFNSELKTIKRLNQIAKKENKIHNIILMIEFGDNREGLALTEIDQTIKNILAMEGINLAGVATNFCCLNDFRPSKLTMQQFKKEIEAIEDKYQLNFKIISSGSSSSLQLLKQGNLFGTQLRVGETILLGREVPNEQQFNQLSLDTFILEAEIVEIKERKINNSWQKRALLAIGKQDISPDSLFPKNNDISIINATSDYLLVNSSKINKLSVGTKLKFNLGYSSLLKSMTSSYITKKYLI